MIKGYIGAGAASLLLMGVAAAADLPSRRAPLVPPPLALPLFSWTGFYVGANAGYAFSSEKETTTSDGSAVAQGQLDAGTVPQAVPLQQHGFAGGGQIGYNYQFGQGPASGIVVGVEADADYTDLRNSSTITAAFNTTDTYKSRLDYLGTVRGRIGYAFDRVLLYGTGGFAYGRTDYAHSFLSNTNPPFAIFSGARSGMQAGYAVGAGVEYALASDQFNPFGSGAVTIRADYLYYDLGSRTTPIPGALAGLTGSRLFDQFRTAGNVVRAGLNFKFGEPAAVPVVARYRPGPGSGARRRSRTADRRPPRRSRPKTR